MVDAILTAAPRPEPRRLSSVSPTLAERLRRCGYRVAFDLDEAYDHLRRDHPIAVLGVVAHRLLERCARGQFDHVPQDGLRGALDEAWTDEVQRAWADLDGQWPLGEVPEPGDTPGYHMTRVRLLRRLRRYVLDRGSVGDTPPPAVEKRRSRRDRVEGWLEDPATGLRGRPDRVERDPEGDVIVDLKTGWTQEGIREEQRRQLLLYAHLWEAETGHLPTHAAVETVTGERYAFEVDADEVHSLVEEVRGAVEAFNLTVGAEVTDLARPAPDTCRTCPYQSVCAPFFRSYEPEWFFERAVVGTVLESHVSTDRGSLDVEATAGSGDATGTIRVLDVPAGAAPDPGTVVAVSNAVPTELPGQLRARWATRLSVWPS